MEEAHTLLTYPTWERYTVLSHVISTLSIRERRRIFQLSRGIRDGEHHNTLFPEHGFTFNEFAVWYILTERKRKTTGKKAGRGT